MHFLIPVLALLTTVSVQAGVYRWTDADGVVHYGDRPVENAQALRVPGLSDRSADAVADRPPQQSDPNQAQGTSGYRQLEIVEPAPGATLRSDEGEVSIAVIVDPPMPVTHHMRLSLDGQVLDGRFNATRVLLRQVGLGSHQLQVTIVDQQEQAIASSDSIAFHMRRSSRRKPAEAE
jgi:hypothetical protein